MDMQILLREKTLHLREATFFPVRRALLPCRLKLSCMVSSAAQVFLGKRLEILPKTTRGIRHRLAQGFRLMASSLRLFGLKGTQSRVLDP